MARQSLCGSRLYFAPLSTMNRTERDAPDGPVTTPSTYVSPTESCLASRPGYGRCAIVGCRGRASSSSPARSRSALVLLETLERQPPMTPRRARGHRHGDERRLRDLGCRGAGERRLLRVRVDAPRTLRDLRDAERDELLGLARDRAALERLLIELEERPVRLRCELPHALELSPHVDAMELHDPSFGNDLRPTT